MVNQWKFAGDVDEVTVRCAKSDGLRHREDREKWISVRLGVVKWRKRDDGVWLCVGEG